MTRAEHVPQRLNITGWLVGLGASFLADQVFFLALTWVAIRVGTPSEVGLVIAAASIPRIAILVVGGALADRANQKRLVVVTDAARAGVLVAATILVLATSTTTWHLVLVALAVGALDGLFLPAIGSLPVRLAPAESMGQVAALRTVTQRFVLLIGGPLAGVLIVWSGPSAAFAVSAALFVVSSSCLATLKLRPQVSDDVESAPASESAPTGRTAAVGRFAREVGAGLSLMKTNPRLRWLMILIAALNLGFAGPVTAGLPLLAAGQGWGATGAGLLLGAFGGGAAVTGLSLAFLKRIPYAGMASLGAVALMGGAFLGLSFSEAFVPAVAWSVFLGMGSGVCGTAVHALLLTLSKPSELGRVMGLLSITLEGVVPISLAVTGLIVQAASARGAFLAGAGLILLAVAVVFAFGRVQTLHLPNRNAPRRAAPNH